MEKPRASLQSRRGRRGPELEILHKHCERSEGPLPREQCRARSSYSSPLAVPD